MRKIDIHSHILPGLDDGARDLEESLELIRMAYDQDIRSFIATPHFSPQFANDCPERIREACAHLEEEAREAVAPDLCIYPGQEIYWKEGVLEKLDRGEILTLAGSMYVLIEFSTRTPYRELHRALQSVRLEGYTPVLAHAERYYSLREEEERIPELIESGALIQLNYESIGGSWHDTTARWCRRQLKDGQVHFLATDMHRADTRPPETEAAVHWMEKKIERGYRACLYQENAAQLLKNESI